MFKTIKQNTSAEIVEKKSKFIANVFYVETVEEAEKIIKEINKKYFDSKHNCFAFSVFTNDGIVNRFSDDGEPSGTAGSPMLNIITSKELTNILVVVTRYFGGILLGTGGLVRAYTGAFQEALKNVKEIFKDLGIGAKITVDYCDLEKFKYYLKQNNVEIIKSEFKENISIFVDLTNNQYENIIKNKNKLNFKIIDIEIIEKKYIEITS